VIWPFMSENSLVIPGGEIAAKSFSKS